MEKKKKLIILILIVIVLIALGFFVKSLFTKDNTDNTTEDNSNLEEQEYSNDEELTEEEDSEEKPHDLKLSIIGPEGETFEKGQARMYKALAEGNGKWDNRVKCHWEFFLNENNEEVLYQTMDNKSILSDDSQEVCGFTTTFIEKRGVLRVKLTMTVSNYADEDLETITAERMYTVL